MVEFLRSPTQANDILGLGQPSAARPKSLFLVRFNRAGAGKGGLDWSKGISFIVKRCDRPTIQITTEEIKQYNKKRLVHTGYKADPVRIDFYDTADSMALRMMDEYTRYYIGDFSQANQSSFRYDVTTAGEMADNGSGFGYTPISKETGPNDLNSQFFFTSIEVYQIYGRHYVQFDLINPRIQTIDPDDMDYENFGPAMISASISYEAILYKNGGSPISFDNPDGDGPASAFEEGLFNGNTLEVTGTPPNISYGRMPLQDEGSFIPNPYVAPEPYEQIERRPLTSSGSLQSFGNYDFGGEPSNTQQVARLAAQNARQPNQQTRNVSASVLDVVSNVVSSFSNYPNVNKELVGDITTASKILSESGYSAVVESNSSPGITLNSAMYAEVNQQKSKHAQIGKRQKSSSATMSGGEALLWHGPRVGNYADNSPGTLDSGENIKKT